MARYSSIAEVSYFEGQDEKGLGDICFSGGSEDYLGMEDEDRDDSKPDFELLEVQR